MDTTRLRAPDPLEAAFRAQRGRLRSLAYRLTGSVEDAEDAVQDAFVRLADRGAPCDGVDLERLLVRIVTNLCIDALRKRRRRNYQGPWLPEPLETATETDCPTDPAGRYDLRESALFAFQLALEALSPRQRAVVVLGDVFGLSAAETGDALSLSEGNVRITRHRARKALAAYDRGRIPLTKSRYAAHRSALDAFLAAIEAGDASRLDTLLADDVETRTDANGEFTALASPLTGRSRVARLYLTAALHRRDAGLRVHPCELNALPAVSIRLARPVRRQAPRSTLSVELDAAGERITRIWTVLAPKKLARLTTP